MKIKVLVVEDDSHIAMGLEEVLKQEDFQPILCKTGSQAVDFVRQEQPGLIILDVMLPGVNGYEICKQLRSQKVTTPILMLTAKGHELDKVIGFDCGADDYVTKPFGVRELTARIHALLRRSQMNGPTSADAKFQIGAAHIDPKTFQLSRGKTTEQLTARELKLLQMFHQHPGEVLSRDKLLNHVWGYNYFGTTRTLDQVIVQLRKKLGEPLDGPKHIQTVHGVGYKYLP